MHFTQFRRFIHEKEQVMGQFNNGRPRSFSKVFMLFLNYRLYMAISICLHFGFLPRNLRINDPRAPCLAQLRWVVETYKIFAHLNNIKRLENASSLLVLYFACVMSTYIFHLWLQTINLEETKSRYLLLLFLSYKKSISYLQYKFNAIWF